MAGAGYRTWTAGEVVTASNVQNFLQDQTIGVYAGTAARSSAVLSPSEGQVSYRTDDDVVEVYNGTAWVPVAPADTAGLVHIKQQTIGSAVSSVNVTGAFSSTYDNYLILVSGGVGSTGQSMTLKIGSSTTGYYATGPTIQYNAVVVGALSTNNGSTFPFAGFSSSVGNVAHILLQGPNLAKNTVYESHSANNISGSGNSYTQNGFLNDTTQHTDFTLAVGGTMTGGEINVYGYRK